MLLAGIQPGAHIGFPLKACGNDEMGYTGIICGNAGEIMLTYLYLC
jgi:hypothetical protein